MIKSKDKNIIIVVPTYNAKGSIIKVLLGTLNNVPNAKILVVDDNSPDKTAQIINKNFLGNKRINVIVRKSKGGRGSAVVRGFKEALKDKKAALFIEMDADLVHNPNDLPRLIEKAKKYDVVVASRYMVSSQIIKWSLKRRLISRFANLWIKFMLGISLTDNTSGFRCYRRYVLETIDFNLVASNGFIVLTEIANQIYKKGFSFAEIPIDFIPVDINRSNLNLKELKEAFFTVLRLKITNIKMHLLNNF
ncbi:MAG: polyprenol monophosphomannose synthase [Patescibacteria group bacterium]